MDPTGLFIKKLLFNLLFNPIPSPRRAAQEVAKKAGVTASAGGRISVGKGPLSVGAEAKYDLVNDKGSLNINGSGSMKNPSAGNKGDIQLSGEIGTDGADISGVVSVPEIKTPVGDVNATATVGDKGVENVQVELSKGIECGEYFEAEAFINIGVDIEQFNSSMKEGKELRNQEQNSQPQFDSVTSAAPRKE